MERRTQKCRKRCTESRLIDAEYRLKAGAEEATKLELVAQGVSIVLQLLLAKELAASCL